MTPQERASLFTSANYNVAEDVEMYAEYCTTTRRPASRSRSCRSTPATTTSSSRPTTSTTRSASPSAASMRSMTTQSGACSRWARGTTRSTRQRPCEPRLPRPDHGFGWDWDLSGGYSRVDQTNGIDGYLVSSRLQDAFGPSFLDPVSGDVVCGTPGNIISGCCPVNIFDINNPAQIDALNTIAASYNQRPSEHQIVRARFHGRRLQYAGRRVAAGRPEQATRNTTSISTRTPSPMRSRRIS